MKARHKAFHAQAELVRYIPQIHLLLLVVYLQQLQEILMYLLLAFKKRPPVNICSVAVKDLKLVTRYIRNLHSTIKGYKNRVPVSIGHIRVLALGHANYVHVVVGTA